MEQLAYSDMAADVGFQSLNAVDAQHEPDLESAEAASQGHLPVTIVGHETRVGEMISKV